MTKPLKTQGKNAWGYKIANLCAPQHRAPQNRATPPFPAWPAPPRLDPPGGGRAPLSLPLLATPFMNLGHLGVKK